MIQEATIESLEAVGVFLENSKAATQKGEYNPFFLIAEMSDEPTEKEIRLLEILVKKYLASKYSSREVKEEFWGLGANTIILLKRAGVWHFRRDSWEHKCWAPPVGLEVFRLFSTTICN